MFDIRVLVAAVPAVPGVFGELFVFLPGPPFPPLADKLVATLDAPPDPPACPPCAKLDPAVPPEPTTTARVSPPLTG